MNNGTPHQRLPKNQNRRAALGRPAIKLLGEGGGVYTTCLLSLLPVADGVWCFALELKRNSELLAHLHAGADVNEKHQTQCHYSLTTQPVIVFSSHIAD